MNAVNLNIGAKTGNNFLNIRWQSELNDLLLFKGVRSPLFDGFRPFVLIIFLMAFAKCRPCGCSFPILSPFFRSFALSDSEFSSYHSENSRLFGLRTLFEPVFKYFFLDKTFLQFARAFCQLTKPSCNLREPFVRWRNLLVIYKSLLSGDETFS